jgi:hypothetical protein
LAPVAENRLGVVATHHRSLHQVGDEEGWWVQLDLDPLIEAQRLWEVTRIEKDEPSSRHA